MPLGFTVTVPWAGAVLAVTVRVAVGSGSLSPLSTVPLTVAAGAAGWVPTPSGVFA